jgi:phosphatidylglycerophosphatase A
MLVLVLPRSYELLLPVAISLFVGGSVCSHLYIIKYRYESNRDPGYVVIDEACGIVLGAIILYTFGFDSVLSIIINFVLFRLFDIFKPFPIGKLEALLKKYDKSVGIGIMVDDVVAAIMASTIQIIGESTTWV